MTSTENAHTRPNALELARGLNADAEKASAAAKLRQTADYAAAIGKLDDAAQLLTTATSSARFFAATDPPTDLSRLAELATPRATRQAELAATIVEQLVNLLETGAGGLTIAGAGRELGKIEAAA